MKMGNGNTKYLNQHTSYLRGGSKIQLNYVGGNILASLLT